MEAALRNRLTYGPMMLLGLFALLVLDHNVQGWTREWAQQHFGPQVYPKDGMVRGIGGVGILILLAIILPLATRELAVLFTAENVRPYKLIAALGSAAIVLHGFLTQFPPFKPIAASTLAFIVVFIPLLAALRRAMKKQTQDAITAMAGTVLATLYLGGLGWFLMAIRVKESTRYNDFKGTTAVILMILLVVKFTDIGAYFGGRALGRRKLIPWLSPGKTWEGLICGMLVAGVVGLIFSRIRGIPDSITPLKGFIFGVVIGGIGQLGDLLESLMKRDAEVKDSGKLIPGFGGVLDVIDSPLLAAPFAYLMYSLL